MKLFCSKCGFEQPYQADYCYRCAHKLPYRIVEAEEAEPGNVGAAWVGAGLTVLGGLLFAVRNQMVIPVVLFYTIMVIGAICSAFGINSNKRQMAIIELIISVILMVVAALEMANRREVLHTN